MCPNGLGASRRAGVDPARPPLAPRPPAQGRLAPRYNGHGGLVGLALPLPAAYSHTVSYHLRFSVARRLIPRGERTRCTPLAAARGGVDCPRRSRTAAEWVWRFVAFSGSARTLGLYRAQPAFMAQEPAELGALVRLSLQQPTRYRISPPRGATYCPLELSFATAPFLFRRGVSGLHNHHNLPYNLRVYN